MTPTFQAVDDRPGLTVIDHIENKQYPLKTSQQVTLTEDDLDGFYFPVESAVEFTTSSLVLPYVVPTYVRTLSGEMVADAEHYAYEDIPRGEYVIEVMAPIRIYVRVNSALLVASSDERLEIDFGRNTRVRLGALSNHEQPATTIETTADPDDLAQVVSTFGSALKTTSCERSLPFLRGHPPRLELGNAVRIPPEINPPETGITIVVPPTRMAVFTITPLAYYLGATVRTGRQPRIETDSGFEWTLSNSTEAFEQEIERILQQVFFLDCLTRTEGLYELDLYERDRFEERADIGFEDVYDLTLSDQLETYLSIPFETIEDLLPRWQLITHATEDPENVPAIPFLADELSFIRSAGTGQTASTELARTDGDPFAQPLVSSSTDNGAHRPTVDSFVSPPKVDAFEQAWLGEGTPIGANKLLQAGFEHELEHTPSSNGIEITIVCNEPDMASELASGLYGDRDELPFDVTIHSNLSVDDLHSVLANPGDFFHYVGHVNNGAFVCKDGTLDASALEDVSVETFLINGCQSYEIGAQLVEAGSVGGIVTLSDVANTGAIAVGRRIARLLNTGFTLRSALSTARSYRFIGNQYLVVGDGGAAVTQAGGGASNKCRVESLGDGRYRVYQTLYHLQNGIGGLTIPYLEGVEKYYLTGKTLPPYELTSTELYRFFQLEQIPVKYNGQFYWSSDERFDRL